MKAKEERRVEFQKIKEERRDEFQKAKEERKDEIQREKEERRDEFREELRISRQEIKSVLETTIDPNGDKKISLGEILGEMFSIHKDVASKEQIAESLVSGGRVTGTNMCLLVLAILIASIGLNVNSTAVIIGAMLISPLMGTIHATAYGTATSNSALAIRALLGFGMQIVISLIASTIYFSISPLSDATSELLARTQPTIWDVMIAICGGLAGIIGVTRKEKTNVIPGVAIATALMPPLCTCGYSIANGKWGMLLGAGYLFAANSYFIYLSATIILIVLGVPKVKERDPKRAKRLKRSLVRNTIIMIVPSIFVAYFMIHSAVEDESTLTGFDTALDVVMISKEMEVLFPEIQEVSVGQLDEVKEDGACVKRNVILLRTDEDVESARFQKEADLIKEWIATRFDGYEVLFE